MATHDVLGLDIGGGKATVAKVENGGVVVLTNELSSRSTPTVVSVPAVAASAEGVASLRLGGASATPHLITHPEHCFNDLGQRKAGLEPEQLKAAFMTHLQTNVIGAEKPCYAVLTVPHYFTDAERAAVLDAASIANIQVVDLINDLAAAALTYGYFQKDLKADEKRQVVLVDFGYSGVQAALVEFEAQGLRVLNVQHRRGCTGGKAMDNKLVAKLVADFKASHDEAITLGPKAMAKLAREAEKAKKIMSSNRNPIQVSVECLQDDQDLHTVISRQEFEAMCQEPFDSVKECLANLILESGIDPKALHSVEVIGGSSRIPRFREIVGEVFDGQSPGSSLNADEAVAKGAALYCASKTRIYSVRPFKTTDVAAYYDLQIKVNTNQGSQTQVHQIFGGNDQESTVVLESRPEGDTVALEYVNKNNHLSKSLIAVYQLDLEELLPDEKIMLSFRTRHGGMPYLISAKCSNDTRQKSVQFTESRLGGLGPAERQAYIAKEREMRDQDRAETQRRELKNSLEDKAYQFKDLLTRDDSEDIGQPWTAAMSYVTELLGTVFDGESSIKTYSCHLDELERTRTSYEARRDQVVKRRKAVKCQVEEDSKHMKLTSEYDKSQEDSEYTTRSKKNENQASSSNVPRSHNRNSRCSAGGRNGSDQRRLYPGNSFMNLYDDFDNDDYFFSPFTAQRRRPHDRTAMFGGFW